MILNRDSYIAKRTTGNESHESFCLQTLANAHAPPSPSPTLSFSFSFSSHLLRSQHTQEHTSLVIPLKLKTLVDHTPELGPHIAVLKTHIDILSDLSPATLSQLTSLSAKHNFLIFEDRKFIDIGSTVQKQYHGGALKIVEWSHIINCSVLPGPGIVEALAQTAESESVKGVDGKVGGGRGLLILAEMTSKGSLATEGYTAASVAIARQFPSFVLGFVSTRSLSSISPSEQKDDKEDFVVFTTGVNMSSAGDALGQQYNTPRKAVMGGADFIICGRGIYKDREPVEAAKRYKKEGWEAYLERTGQV